MSILSLTYAELAERLGVSVDGARMKVKRAGWPKVKGNDGTMRVTVEEAELTPTERSPNVRPPFAEQPNEQAVEQVRTLEAHIATLKEQVAAVQDQLGKAETTAAQERGRADAEREKVADLTAQLLKITGQMMELQQAHEADRHRPWWRRLSGALQLAARSGS
jgi:outer membrane murein-binding lipoprotein Lpp